VKALLAVALLTAGCSSSVTVDAPSPDQPDAAQCARLLAVLPDRVAGQSSRQVRPAGELAAAWGDPAVVLRCGVPKPLALRADSACLVVNGVGWFAAAGGRPVTGTEPVTGPIVFTTVGRSPYVDVLVPPDYQPAADALVDLSSAVRRTTTQHHPCL
jgi:Protein of unknown function (DUF3515)